MYTNSFKFNFVFICALFGMLSTNLYAAPQSLDRIAAIVNDDIITVHQVQSETHSIRLQLQQAHASVPPQNVLYENALNQLIDKKLQLQIAKNMGIEVSDAALATTINDIAKRNGITPEILKQKLTAEGVNYSSYQQDIRDQITVNQVQQRQIAPNVSVSEEEVKQIQHKIKPPQENKRYHVIDILIPLSENATPEQVTTAQSKAQKLMNDLHKDADFSRLAIAQAVESHLPNGGDFGWQTLDQLPELFAQKIHGLSPGQITGPIRAGNGLHIIKLEGIQGESFAHHYSKQTHVRHILIKLDKTTNDEIAKIHLLQLKEKLNRGADFAETAKSNSQDNLSNTKGGELDWVSEGILDPNFEKTMNQLKINQIGGPVKTPFGWHLIQVLGRRQVEDTKDILSNQARNIAYQEKIQQSLPTWLQQLHNSAYIKKYPSSS
jgi:peptidyl-prolyl cis-trans isomerase SurA